MDTTKLNDSERTVIDFIGSVEQEKRDIQNAKEFDNSTKVKLRVLDKEKDKLKKDLVNGTLSEIFVKSVPLSDDYKVANDNELKDYFGNFIKSRYGEDIDTYVTEVKAKNKSAFIKKLLEAAETEAEEEFKDKALNIDDIKVDELVFNSPEDTSRKIDIIGKDLDIDEISDIINNNVKETAMSEITRAKREKEKLKEVEAELAKDINIDSEEKVEEALELRGLNNTKDYTPTLFEGVMIGSTTKINSLVNSGQLGNINIYNTLAEYGRVTEGVGSPEELAFIESIKEYTCLSMLKALKFEDFNLDYVNNLANEYAYTVK